MYKKILFVCVHNSARSQMAEAFAKKYGGGNVFVESAGLEPGTLNQDVVKVMSERGIDISGNKTKSVFDFFKEGRTYNYVIAVCDKEAAENCPIFPGFSERLHWPFPDPSAATGSEEERLEKVRKIRDEIEDKIKNFLNAVL
ncbi:arsenate reductase ArsC [Flexistipes sp.]|uniref:arsenate reductase ArsC n=1 Tax=Flexistipes sp. TaxID=3088135 RepID=UPI002E2165E1|nr:arsenate reductase ArsC [Flexistipes sp.]